MDIQVISEVISTMGFPVFVSIYLLVYMKREMQQTREVILKLESTIQKLCLLVNDVKRGV